MIATVQREILRWLEVLELQYPVRNPKWDLSNGFIIGEIVSWYHPDVMDLEKLYPNSDSVKYKTSNWDVLRQIFKKLKWDIEESLIYGTIHCKDNASVLLLERIYEILTNRKVKRPKLPHEDDPLVFSNEGYQSTLPLHARDTAATAIKANIRLTENQVVQNQITRREKAATIVSNHLDNRYMQRVHHPNRFSIAPTIAERCPRKEAKQHLDDDSTTQQEPTRQLSINTDAGGDGNTFSNVQFKQIAVKQ